MRIVLLGPPLSGKGTQGQLLAERLNLPRLSVGALIRKLYYSKKSEGLAAAKYMHKGEAIPADLLIKIIGPWFKKNTKSGFVIDNLVRDNEQLEAFKQYSIENKFLLDIVINITLAKEEIFKRFATRITEHEKNNRVREDETLLVLKKRIAVYNSSIGKIAEYFKKQNIYHKVLGNHSVSKVHEDILNILKINGDY